MHHWRAGKHNLNRGACFKGKFEYGTKLAGKPNKEWTDLDHKLFDALEGIAADPSNIRSLAKGGFSGKEEAFKKAHGI